MIRYQRHVSRDAPPGAVADTEAHVRAHLSAVADADDDPTTNSDDVRITVEPDGDGLLVVGVLHAEASAPYLADGFDPYDGVPDDLRAEAVR